MKDDTQRTHAPTSLKKRDDDGLLSAMRVVELLVAAYDQGEERGGSVRWEDLDLAYALARKVLASR